MNVDRKLVLAGGMGCGAGVLVPVAMERFLPQFWNSDLLFAGVYWSQKKIIFPLGIGASLMGLGYLVKNKNESFATFGFVCGMVMFVKGLFDLVNILGGPQTRAAKNRFLPPSRPLAVVRSDGAQFTRAVSKTGIPESDSTSTFISKKVILA